MGGPSGSYVPPVQIAPTGSYAPPAMQPVVMSGSYVPPPMMAPTGSYGPPIIPTVANVAAPPVMVPTGSVAVPRAERQRGGEIPDPDTVEAQRKAYKKALDKQFQEEMAKIEVARKGQKQML